MNKILTARFGLQGILFIWTHSSATFDKIMITWRTFRFVRHEQWRGILSSQPIASRFDYGFAALVYLTISLLITFAALMVNCRI